MEQTQNKRQKRIVGEEANDREYVKIFENEEPMGIFTDSDKHTQYGGKHYKFKVVIDDREICPGVKEYLLKNAQKHKIHLEIVRQRLTVADYLFRADDYAVAIRERKRIDDFFYSLFDDRYIDQKERLKETKIPLQGYVFTRTADDNESKQEMFDILFGGQTDTDAIKGIKEFIDSKYHIVPRHTKYNKETKQRIVLTDDELQSYYTALNSCNGTELVSDRFLPQYLWGVLKEVVHYVKVHGIQDLPSALHIEKSMGKRQVVDPRLFLQAALQSFCPDATAAFLSTKYAHINILQQELKESKNELYLSDKFPEFVKAANSKKIYQFLV